MPYSVFSEFLFYSGLLCNFAELFEKRPEADERCRDFAFLKKSFKIIN